MNILNNTNIVYSKIIEYTEYYFRIYWGIAIKSEKNCYISINFPCFFSFFYLRYIRSKLNQKYEVPTHIPKRLPGSIDPRFKRYSLKIDPN